MALNFCNINSLSSITALPSSISGGGLNLISTQTASGSSSLSFTSGIDSTYKEYVFKFINMSNMSLNKKNPHARCTQQNRCPSRICLQESV